MGVSKNRGTPKSSILIGIPIINHPFWGTPIFGNIQIDFQGKAVCFMGRVRNPFDDTGFDWSSCLPSLDVYFLF